MAYHHKANTHHRAKRVRKVRRFVIGFFLLCILISGVIALDWVRAQLKSDVAVSVESTATVQSSNINIFRTPYFQFQTGRKWREVASESSDKKFVYRSFDGLLIEHELIIEINQNTDVVLDNTSITRVLPVVVEDSRLNPTSAISPHCRELIDKELGRDQRFVKYEGVTFPCSPDRSNFVVVVGEVEGKHYIEKPTFDGLRTYVITYRDSTFSPNGQPLSNIIRTFQLL